MHRLYMRVCECVHMCLNVCVLCECCMFISVCMYMYICVVCVCVIIVYVFLCKILVSYYLTCTNNLKTQSRLFFLSGNNGFKITDIQQSHILWGHCERVARMSWVKKKKKTNLPDRGLSTELKCHYVIILGSLK